MESILMKQNFFSQFYLHNPLYYLPYLFLQDVLFAVFCIMVARKQHLNESLFNLQFFL